jgi:hypothetical protein
MTFNELNESFFKENSKKIGQRVLTALKYRNKQVKELLPILNLSKGTISKCNTGNGRYYKKSDVKKIADFLDVLPEYLCLLVNYKTSEELENNLELRFEYKISLLYLKYLGYNITPVIYWRGSELSFSSVYEELKPYINILSAKKIQKDYNNFKNINISDLSNKKMLRIQLNGSPTNKLSDFNQLTKNVNFDKFNYMVYFDETKKRTSGILELRFDISLKDKQIIKDINLFDLNNLFKIMDDTNKMFINSFLSCYSEKKLNYLF